MLLRRVRSVRLLRSPIQSGKDCMPGFVAGLVDDSNCGRVFGLFFCVVWFVPSSLVLPGSRLVQNSDRASDLTSVSA